MKEKLEMFLLETGIWEHFIDSTEEALTKSNLISIQIISFSDEGNFIYFDVSIVYRNNSGQRQVIESGVALIGNDGDILEAHTHVP